MDGLAACACSRFSFFRNSGVAFSNSASSFSFRLSVKVIKVYSLASCWSDSVNVKLEEGEAATLMSRLTNPGRPLTNAEPLANTLPYQMGFWRSVVLKPNRLCMSVNEKSKLASLKFLCSIRPLSVAVLP